MRTIAIAATVLALAMLAPAAFAADTQLLLVHGYGSASPGKDCNGRTWKNALAYYQDAGGRERSSMSTIGYHVGDGPADCDVIVGDGRATNDRPIQDIARDLAKYIDDAYSSKGRPVNIIAHSMGGLIARVALLGSAQGWDGFPARLNVNNVVTLSTPHQGLASPSANDDRVESDGPRLGLHGAAPRAGQRPRRRLGERHRLEPRGVTRCVTGTPRVIIRPHDTENGWSPLKTAFQAATKIGDGLPR